MSDVGRDASGDIAIIGLGCRLPGANGSTAATPDAFWEVLRDEVDLLREVPEERWPRDFFSEDDRASSDSNLHSGHFLGDVAGFDAGFFGLEKEEAEKSSIKTRDVSQKMAAMKVGV